MLTLRSKTIDGVYQEIGGALTAYSLARLGMAKAALDVKCDPTGVSFIWASHVIQYELRWAAATRAQGKLPSLLKRLRKRLVDLLNAFTAWSKVRPGRESIATALYGSCAEKNLTERHYARRRHF